MNKKKKGAVLKVKKGLEGFFTNEEAEALNRNILQAAGTLGMTEISPIPAKAFQTVPSHANSLHNNREIQPPRVVPNAHGEPRRSRGSR